MNWETLTKEQVEAIIRNSFKDLEEIWSCKLYVAQLPHDMGDEELKKLFAKIGTVESVKIIRDDSGRSMGFGFVTMANSVMAQNAVQYSNKMEPPLTIKPSLKPRYDPEKPHTLEEFAESYQQLAERRLKNSMYSDAMRFANIAFECYRYLKSPDQKESKKRMIQCISIYLQAFLKAKYESTLPYPKINEIKPEIESLLKQAYSFQRIIPRKAGIVAKLCLFNFFDEQRKRLMKENPVLIQEFLMENFLQIWEIDCEEVRVQKREWLQNVEEFCPQIAKLVITTTSTLNKDKLEKIEQLKRDGNFSEIASLLEPIAKEARQGLASALEKYTKFKEPLAYISTRVVTVSHFCKIAYNQYKERDYEGALVTLRKISEKDPLNPSIIKWRIYLNSLLENYIDVETDYVLLDKIKELDSETRWNFACMYYRKGNYSKAFESFLKIREEKVQFKRKPLEGLTEILLGLALQMNQNDFLIENLINEVDPYLLALGYVLAFNAGKEDQLKNYLNRLINVLKYDFRPFPIDEPLDEEETKETLSFFINNNLFEEGIEHFELRIMKGQIGWHIYEALFNLMELSRMPEEVFNRCCLLFQKLMGIVGIKYKKNKVFCYLLNFALKHKEIPSIRIESIRLWKSYGKRLLDEGVLTENEYSYFDRQFSKLLSMEPSSLEEAWNRIQRLNIDLKNINNPTKLANKKFMFYEYSGLIPIRYDNEVGHDAGSLMREIVDVLCSLVEKPLNEEEAVKMIRKADNLYFKLLEKIDGLGPTAKHEFLLVRNLGACIANAERQLIPAEPKIRILNQSLPPDPITTSLVVEVTNDSENPIENFYLDLETEPDIFELEGSSRVECKRILPHESEILAYQIKRIKESDVNKFRLTYKFRCRGKEYAPKELPEFTIPTKPFREIPAERYVYTRAINIDEPEKFHGREHKIEELLQIFSPEGKGGRFVFLDGIRKVGKTSLINFFSARLPKTVVPVVINLDGKDVNIDTYIFLYEICTEIIRKLSNDNTATPPLTESEFKKEPVKAFIECINRFRALYPTVKILLIIDEFQNIVRSILEHKEGKTGLDETVLNLMRYCIENCLLDFIFTGSIRLSEMKEYVTHRIFASVTKRIVLSFLDYSAVKSTLQEPVKIDGVIYPEKAIKRIWELVRGHPQLTQKIGNACMDRLNFEKRYVVTLQDVEEAAKSLLTDTTNFQHWWDPKYLKDPEEEVMRVFLKLQKNHEGVSINELVTEFGAWHTELIKALNNLLEQQVLTPVGDRYMINGELLEQYIRSLLGRKVTGPVLNYCILAFDHENFYITLTEEYWAKILSKEYNAGKALSEEECKDLIKKFKNGEILGESNLGKIIKNVMKEKLPDKVLEEAIKKIVEDAEKYGEIVKSFAVACFQIDKFFEHQKIYWKMKIKTEKPDIIEKNISDDTLRKLLRESLEDKLLGSERTIGTIILISGDGDFARPGGLLDSLRAQGRRVLVRGFKSNTHPQLKEKVGAGCFKYIDDIINLDSLLKEIGEL